MPDPQEEYFWRRSSSVLMVWPAQGSLQRLRAYVPLQLKASLNDLNELSVRHLERLYREVEFVITDRQRN